MKTLGATISDLENPKSKDFIPFIAYDIKEVFEKALSQFVADTVKTPGGNAWVQNFQRGGWLTLETVRSIKVGQQLTQLLMAEMPIMIKTEDHQKFVVLATEIGSLYDGCVKNGGYTTDTIKFLTRFRDLPGNALERTPIKLYHMRWRRLQDVGKGLQHPREACQFSAFGYRSS